MLLKLRPLSLLWAWQSYWGSKVKKNVQAVLIQKQNFLVQENEQVNRDEESPLINLSKCFLRVDDVLRAPMPHSSWMIIADQSA